jgi:hypothetical protein
MTSLISTGNALALGLDHLRVTMIHGGKPTFAPCSGGGSTSRANAVAGELAVTPRSSATRRATLAMAIFNVSNSLAGKLDQSRGGCARVLHRVHTLFDIDEGAGKAGCRPHPWLPARKQAVVTTGTSRSSGLPCATVLRLIRDLPGAPGFLATMIRAKR